MPARVDNIETLNIYEDELKKAHEALVKEDDEAPAEKPEIDNKFLTHGALSTNLVEWVNFLTLNIDASFAVYRNWTIHFGTDFAVTTSKKVDNIPDYLKTGVARLRFRQVFALILAKLLIFVDFGQVMAVILAKSLNFSLFGHLFALFLAKSLIFSPFSQLSPGILAELLFLFKPYALYLKPQGGWEKVGGRTFLIRRGVR